MRPDTSTHYRPDIDGLRAIAVLSVVLYHAKPGWLPGGFTGVDIFFVISGYLISTIIMEKLAINGFSIASFYARRVRRIFPALTVVFIATLITGWLVLFPDEFRMLGKHTVAGAAFFANIVFWRESGYFDAATELKPLLHLWSLGVEEQFYIVWPLVLFVTWRYRQLQFAALLVLAIVSFALNVARVDGHADATFYLLPTRAWELAAGALLAHRQLFAPSSTRAAWQSELMAALGIACLVFALVVVDSHRAFPGWWALAPVLGAVLLIAAGRGAWINRRLLGCAPMVYVGLISYPLYLWHWPVLTFARLLDPGAEHAATIPGAVVASFVLAASTFACVELPIRTRPRLRATVPLALALAACAVVGLLMQQGVLRPRSAAMGVERFLSLATAPAADGPDLQELVESGNVSELGKSPARVLLFGDSQVAQMYPRVARLMATAPERTASVAILTSGGCVPIASVKEARHPWCEGLVQRALDYAARPEIHTVVIGASWYRRLVAPVDQYDYYFDDHGRRLPLTPGSGGLDLAYAELEKMVGGLIANGKRVVLVMPIPVGEFNDPRTLPARRFGDLSFRIVNRPIDRLQFVARFAPVQARLVELAQRTGATIIDPVTTLCAATTCPTVDARGEPVYRDSGHLRAAFIRDHATWLDAVLSTP